jgi:hypothetical protein
VCKCVCVSEVVVCEGWQEQVCEVVCVCVQVQVRVRGCVCKWCK